MIRYEKLNCKEMNKMILNDRNFYKSYEIIGGEKIMAPAAPVGHSSIIFELAFIIKSYLRKTGV